MNENNESDDFTNMKKEILVSINAINFKFVLIIYLIIIFTLFYLVFT